MALDSITVCEATNISAVYSGSYGYSETDLSGKSWSQCTFEVSVSPSNYNIKQGKSIVFNYSFSDNTGLQLGDLETKFKFTVTLDSDGGLSTSEPVNVTGDYVYTWLSTVDNLVEDVESYNSAPWEVSANAVQYLSSGGSSGGGSVGAPPYNAGTLSGETGLDYSNGGFQYCNLNGDTVFVSPSNGAEGSELVIGVQYTNGVTVDFDTTIKKASLSGITFPMAFPALKSGIFKLVYLGGYWCLVSFVGFFDENVD